MSQPREGFFWDVMEGRRPAPPAAALLGFQLLEVDAEQGTLRAQFEATPQFLNPAGNVQGGFLAAMLDDTMGPALAATLGPGQFAPTLNLNVSFERPGQVGTIVGHGRVLKRGSDVCFLGGELFQDGKRIASATATALIRTMPTG